MRIVSIVLAAALFPSQAIAGASTPDEVAREFYSWALSQPGAGSGLPTEKEKERLTELFSSGLIQLLEAAIAMEKRCIEANAPGDKPYTIEGNILVGNYEGATEVIVGEPRNEKKNIIVESRLFSVDSQFQKSHKHRVITWIDQLVINRDGNKWVISNIKFETGRTLSGSLDEYLKNGAKWCKALNTSFSLDAQKRHAGYLGVKCCSGEG